MVRLVFSAKLCVLCDSAVNLAEKNEPQRRRGRTDCAESSNCTTISDYVVLQNREIVTCLLMSSRRLLIAPALLTLLIFGLSAFGQAPSPVDIAFTVGMSRPHTHLFEIDVSIKRAATATAPADELLVMPVWTPGSYLVREFERHVQDFAAKDAAG